MIDVTSQKSYKPRGSLVVICGSMCSGKTEELIRIISRQIIVRKNNVQTFKPLIDTRILKTNSKVYTKIRKGRKNYSFKEYKAEYTICKNCINKDKCASTRLNRNQGRFIERYLTADYTEANRERVKNNKNYYRERQSIVEHPFGTIKRQWGYSYTLFPAGVYGWLCHYQYLEQ